MTKFKKMKLMKTRQDILVVTVSKKGKRNIIIPMVVNDKNERAIVESNMPKDESIEYYKEKVRTFK